MRFACVNVRGWGVSKLEDMSKEMSEWNIDIVGVTETQLRDDVKVEGSEYIMLGKGRKKQEKRGGGVALLHRKCRNYKVEEIDVGKSAASEDVMAVRIECENQQGKSDQMIVVVVYNYDSGR